MATTRRRGSVCYFSSYRDRVQKMMYRTILFVLLAFQCCSGQVPDGFVHHYEPLQYDQSSLLWHHHRVTRSSVGDKEIRLHFRSFGRLFDLTLKPDTQLFHNDFKLEVSDRDVDNLKLKSLMYTGYDKNDSSIRAHGNLAHGMFEGSIHADGETYYVEPASRHWKESVTNFHSIIYRHSDINNSVSTHGSCGVKNQAIYEYENSGRLKRISGRVPDKNKVRCWLYILGDYKFYSNIPTASDPEERALQASAIISSYVKSASEIYEGTDFDMDGSRDNIVFGIKRIVIESSPPDSTSVFSEEFLGVESFLEYHSRFDYDLFCLAYRFTHRDFDGGVLGLAFVAPQPGSPNAGGICERYKNIGGVEKSLNTGVVTTLNYGKKIPTAVTALTFAHEAGHNFGSEHDDPNDVECSPSGNKFIMYAFASDGSQRKFSKCSQDMMNTVIESRGQDSGGCFVPSDQLCGNNIIDDGEMCDCGGETLPSSQLCVSDHCCNATSCLLAHGADCSPQQGVCCNRTSCTLYSADDNIMCSEATECAKNQTCNGTYVQCPKAEPIGSANSSAPCNGGSNYCLDGECTGSICIPLGLIQCECPTIEEACDVCCTLGNGSCVSTLRIASDDVNGLASKLPEGKGRNIGVGEACGNFTGYCDFLYNCQLVNSEGALSRLANIVLNQASINNVIDIVSSYWWAILLGGVGTLMLMFFVVVLCHFTLPRPEHMKRRAQKRRERQ